MRKGILLFMSVVMLAGSTMSASAASMIVPVPAPVVPVSTEPDPAKVKEALDEFKSLSKRDRKDRLKEVKKEWKDYKKAKKAGKEPSENTVLLCILAVLLPPLAVYLYEGEINNRFWISLLLTLLFWLPGIIYALVLILGKH